MHTCNTITHKLIFFRQNNNTVLTCFCLRRLFGGLGVILWFLEISLSLNMLYYKDIFVLKHVVLPRNEQKLRIFSSQNTTFSLKIQRGRHLRPFEAWKFISNLTNFKISHAKLLESWLFKNPLPKFFNFQIILTPVMC